MGPSKQKHDMKVTTKEREEAQKQEDKIKKGKRLQAIARNAAAGKDKVVWDDVIHFSGEIQALYQKT